jgi:hypothetical protein
VTMEGTSAGSSRTEAVGERREQPTIRFAVAPSKGRLHEALMKVDWELVDLEYSSVERVRLILSEILGRSTGRDAEIRIDIFVLSKTIRIELSGRSLALPEDLTARPDAEPSYPSWLLTHLVDGWGIDQRESSRGIWLLLDR